MEKLNRRKFIKRGIYGLGAILSCYTFFVERYLFQINTYQIPVPNLPKAFNGFTIVQLTDFHYGFLMPLKAVKHIIHRANSINTDIIVCTGDYVHEKKSTKQIDTIWPELIKLKARHGVFSTLGNHDHWADFKRSMFWLNKSGQNIRHKVIPISKKNHRIWIGGAGDLLEDRVGIDKMFKNVPQEECRVCLAHNPDTADRRFKTRIDLMISGHTHGGQVNIPFYGPPILPVENKLYSNGFIKTKKTNLFISKGLGWSLLPVRFNCYPEIAVLKLTNEKK